MLSEFDFSIDGTRHFVRGEAVSATLSDYLKGWRGGLGRGGRGGDDLVGVGTHDGNGHVVVRVIEASHLYLPQLAGKEVMTVEGVATELREVGTLMGALLDDRPSRRGTLVMTAFESSGGKEAGIPGNLAQQVSAGRDVAIGWESVPMLQRWISGARKVGRQPKDLLREVDVASRGSFCYEDAKGRRYYRCGSIDEVFRLRREYPRAQLVNRGFLSGWETTNLDSGRGVGYVISLEAVAELGGLLDLDHSMELGAACSMSSVCEAVAEEFPDYAAAVGLSYRGPALHQLSLGGLLASRNSAGAAGGALLVEDAMITLHSCEGEREVTVEEFYSGEAVFRDDDLIGGVRLRKPERTENTLRGHERIRRGLAGTEAVLDFFCRIELDSNGGIENARLALASHGRHPQFLKQVSKEMVGKTWEVEMAKEVTRRIREEADCGDSSAASAKYRQAMAGALWQKFFFENPEPGVRRSLQPELEETWNGSGR